MVKTRHVPCSPEELRRARDTVPPYGSTLTKSEGGEGVLLLRVPRPTPDLVNDLDAALRLLPTRSAAEAHHVVLVGDRDALTLSANTVRPLVRARDDREAARLDTFRAEPPFAFAWFRFPGDPRAATRLAVRLPVPRVGHLEDRDADAIAVALGASLDVHADRGCLCVYLVADDDHARLAPAEFLAEVRQRWSAAKQRVEALARPVEPPARAHVPTPAAPEAAVAVPPPTPAPDVRAFADHAAEKVLSEFFERELAKRAPPVRRTLPRMPAGAPPSRFVFAYSEVVEARPRTATPASAAASPAPAPTPTVAPAQPAPTAPAQEPFAAAPEPATRPSPWDAVRTELRDMLVRGHYEVLEGPSFAGLTFAFAAAREGAAPEKVLVYTCDDLSPSLSKRVLAAARELTVDACIVLAPRVSVEAERNLIATKVSVYHPASLSELSFG